MTRPNWCKNVVSLYGAPEHITDLVEHVKGEMDFEFDHTLNGNAVAGQLFSFKSIIPYEGKWDSSVGLAKWGVRCEAVEVHLDYCHGNFATYEFQTPWTPPFPIYNAIKNRFVDIYCSWFYHEPLSELVGYMKSEPKIKKVS